MLFCLPVQTVQVLLCVVLLSSPIKTEAYVPSCTKYTDAAAEATCQLLYDRLFDNSANAGDTYGPTDAAESAGLLATNAVEDTAAPGDVHPPRQQDSAQHAMEVSADAALAGGVARAGKEERYDHYPEQKEPRYHHAPGHGGTPSYDLQRTGADADKRRHEAYEGTHAADPQTYTRYADERTHEGPYSSNKRRDAHSTRHHAGTTLQQTTPFHCTRPQRSTQTCLLPQLKAKRLQQGN